MPEDLDSILEIKERKKKEIFKIDNEKATLNESGGGKEINPSKIVGSIVLAVGILLCLWGGFQYLSNLPSEHQGDGFSQLMGGLENIGRAGIRKEAGKYFIFGLVISGVGGAVLAYGKNVN